MTVVAPHNVHLSPRQRAVYQLRFVEGLALRDIAQRFGVTVAAVCNRVIAIRAAFVLAGRPEPEVPGRYAVRTNPMTRVAG